jgi:hypothetical protein
MPAMHFLTARIAPAVFGRPQAGEMWHDSFNIFAKALVKYFVCDILYIF